MMYIIRTKRRLFTICRETNGRKLGEFSLDFETITILNSEEPRTSVARNLTQTTLNIKNVLLSMREVFPNRDLLIPIQHWKHQNNVKNLFKFHNKHQSDVNNVTLQI